MFDPARALRRHGGRHVRVLVAGAPVVLLAACAAVNEDGLPRVKGIAHWGHYEEAKDVKEVAALVRPDFINFTLGPQVPRAAFDLDGNTINLEFVEAHEAVSPDTDIELKFYARTVDLCQDETSYLKLRVNGCAAILLPEQLKEVTLENGYRFLVSARDVEDMRQREPSELVLIQYR